MADGILRGFVQGDIHIDRSGLPQQGQVAGHYASIVTGFFKVTHHKGNLRVFAGVQKIGLAEVVVPFIVVGKDTAGFENQLPGIQFSGFFVVFKLAFNIPEHAHHRGITDMHDFEAHGKVLFVHFELSRLCRHAGSGGQQD